MRSEDDLFTGPAGAYIALMFTGIVTDVGTLLAVEDHGAGLRRLRISCAYPVEEIAIGASVAHAGVCLTVVGKAPGWIEVDAAAETLRLTTVGCWNTGDRINLERALKIGDELGGHIVSGHVDGLATVIARDDLAADPSAPWGATVRFTLRVPAPLHRFIAQKGSVTLDGVSLTVNTVENNTFSVLLIPHTLQETTLGGLRVGSDVNIEIDLMARYAARLAETA